MNITPEQYEHLCKLIDGGITVVLFMITLFGLAIGLSLCIIDKHVRERNKK